MMPTAALSEVQKQVLESIAKGFHSFVEIADANIIEAARVAELVEELELDGYIRRRAYWGFGFNEVDLTDLGVRAITLSDADRQALNSYGVNRKSLDVLRFLLSHPGSSIVEVSEGLGESPISLVPYCNQLISAGLVKDGGLWRRTFTVTAKGQQAAGK